jgi:anthranilate synthase/aminodeoxychorismate synthase-like glutamine amidotransferase
MLREVLLVDNYDSFTYNLMEELSCLGCRVRVYRNDTSADVLAAELDRMHDPLLVLSPGPGTPEEAGCCVELIRRVQGRHALLGVCLGHQALTVAMGGTVGPAPRPLHGERSRMRCHPHPIFAGLPNPMWVGRYHSLVALALPPQLNVLADADGVVMAVAHERHALAGLQFHPESILTTHGRRLLLNVVRHWRESGGGAGAKAAS